MSFEQTATYRWNHYGALAVIGVALAWIFSFLLLVPLLSSFAVYWAIGLVRPATGRHLHLTLSWLAGHIGWIGIAGTGDAGLGIPLPEIAISLILLFFCVIFLSRIPVYALMAFETAAIGISFYDWLGTFDTGTLGVPLLIDIGIRMAILIGALVALDSGPERAHGGRPKAPEYNS